MEVFDYRTVEPEEVPEATGANVRWLIDEEKGAPNFAMRVFEVEPGGKSPAHSHWYEQEMFILSGEGRLKGEGESFALSKGTVMYIPPFEEHKILNESDETLTFICCIPLREEA